MNNDFQIQSFPLTVFGGAVPEMSDTDLPPGAAAAQQDVDYRIGSVITRPGIVNSFTYQPQPPLAAKSGANVFANRVFAANPCLPTPPQPCETPWTTPNNISFNTEGTYAVVTLNTPIPAVDGFTDYQNNADDQYSLTGTTITAPDIATTETNSIAFFFTAAASATPTFDAPWTDTGWLTSYGSIGYQIINPAGDTGGGTAHQLVNQPWAAGTFSLGLIGNTLPTQVQHVANSGAWNADQHLTFPGSNTAGNVIMVFQISNDVITPRTPSVTDTNGNVYNHIIIGGGGTLPALDVWLAFDIAGGANTVTLAVNGGFFANAYVDAIEFTAGANGFAACTESEYLAATNFGFTVPTTDIIGGLQLQLNGLMSSLTTINIDGLQTGGSGATIFCTTTVPFSPGNTVTIAGLSNAPFMNGVWTIATVSGTEFTIAGSFTTFPAGSHSDSDSGTATVGVALPDDAVVQISANQPGSGIRTTRLSPNQYGSVTVGGPTDTFDLGANMTATILDNPAFGFNIQAFAPDGTPITFSISGAVLTVYLGAPTSFLYVKTLTQPDETNLTLALDADGTLWQEQVNLLPNILSSVFTNIEPNTYAKSVTANFREYLALSNLITGTDMPRQYDGNFFDRVSQCAPGAPPAISGTSTGVTVVSVSQPTPKSDTTEPGNMNDILWSAGPGNTQPGNVLTLYYEKVNTMANPDPDLIVGRNVALANFAPINGNTVNGDYVITGVGRNTPPGAGSDRWYLTVNMPSTLHYQAHQGGNRSGTYQVTLATVTTSAQVPNVEVGNMLTLAGTGGGPPTGYDGTWTVLATPNASQFQVTTTQLTSNVATYSYSLISGSNPIPGQYVTITDTLNGNGIFNVSNVVIQSASPGNFSLSLTSPNISNAAESGDGTVFGTQFQFDPLQGGIGTKHGGTVVTSGVFASGPRQCVVLFQTRNGGITPASVPATFDVTGGASSIAVTGIPTGPPDVTSRILAFTAAGANGVPGGFFYYIPQPVSVVSNGQKVYYSSTVVNDNTSTSATLSFPDAVLLASTEIDIQGQNYFQTLELGSCLGVIDYSNRLFWWGEQNKVQNFVNMSFDGGFTSTGVPLGWTVDPTVPYDGAPIVSPNFGNAFYVKNTEGSTQDVVGRITQPASVDFYGVNIIEPNTTYSVRISAASPSNTSSGNVVVDLFNANSSQVIGSYTVALSSLSATTSINSGALLTIPLSTTTAVGPPPPPPGPPIYSAEPLQFAVGSTRGNVFNDHRDNTLYVTLPNPVRQGGTVVICYTSFHYNGGPGSPNRLTVTDNRNNQYVPYVNNAQASGSEFNKYLLIATNCAGGATTIHFDEGYNSHSNSYMLGIVSEWEGLASPIAADGTASNESAFTPTFSTGTINTGFANDVIFTDVGAFGTVPSGYTLIGTVDNLNSHSNGYLSAAFKVLTATGSQTPTWHSLASGGVSSGITAAFRLTPSNPPPPPPTPVTAATPLALQLRVWGQNVPNGGDFSIDRIEVFPTQQPVLGSQFRASYENAFDEYDGITGNTGPNQDSKPILGAAVLWDNLYCLKQQGGIYSTFDNGQTEPNQWSWSTVSSTVGTVGVHAYDYGEDWLVTADRNGLWVYGGGPLIKISQEIQPVWQQIINYQNTVVKVDIASRRIYVLACMVTPNKYMPEFPANPNPQTPNVCLMMNFREVDTIQALASAKPVHQTFSGSVKAFDFSRKWSYWNIQSPYAAFCERSDGSSQFLICGNNNAKIFTLSDNNPVYSDDGLAINSYYTTFGFPQVEGAMGMQLGIYQLEAMYSVLTVVGNGTLNIADFPDTPVTPDANWIPPVPLSNPAADTEVPINDIGSRFFMRFGTNAPGEWFQLSKVGLTLQKSPWAPVKGGTY